ncbi:MAG TPA: O-antigen ligase family protein [Elusimicrobiales bacterium]|nr:O-antigen ligase family protein [Elusimicrobiales bacterium]
MQKTQLPGVKNLNPAVVFTRKAVVWWMCALYLLVSVCFYLRTYDSAQIKITLVQMGGVALIALWGALLALEGRKAFRKEDLPVLAPFFFYLAYVWVSFMHAPYKGPSLDDFIRYNFYIVVALIAMTEFDRPAIGKMTKTLIAANWIVSGYGMVQFLDSVIYPPSVHSSGLDPFLWRGAFGHRVFSTYGNPNFFADFVLLISFVVLAQYLKTRAWRYLPLLAMNLLNLYLTETKGAWLGFGAACFIFILVYSFIFLRRLFDKHRMQFIGVAVAVPLFCGLAVTYYAHKRMNSVNFRVFTWLSTWEMIQTHPLLGTGVGTFKVIYPTYRRPQIFHIEGKHNTETDHAENEYLEQWMDNGTIGFGLFLWMVLFTVVAGLKALRRLVDGNQASRPPPEAYDLLGYLTAFLATMSHNFFDVSMRFVSSGVFLGLLPGLILNLSRGKGLYELHYEDETAGPAQEPRAQSTFDFYSLIGLRFLAWAGIIVLVVALFREMPEMQGPYLPTMPDGELLQWALCWVVFTVCVLGLGFVALKIAAMSHSRTALLVLLAALYPVYYLWGFFKADIYHNLAIYLSKRRDWDLALTYYEKVNKHNPYFLMSHYFRGNVYKDRFDMVPQYRPEWGDKDQTPRTDFDRAMEVYEHLRRMAPNYVQMHYQVGELYMRLAKYQLEQGESQKAKESLDKALKRFELYHNLDPVFPYTYYMRGNIYTGRGELDRAEKEFYSAIHPFYKPEPNESAMSYYNLAGAQLRLGKVLQAQQSLERALELEPNHAQSMALLNNLRAGIAASAPRKPAAKPVIRKPASRQ